MTDEAGRFYEQFYVWTDKWYLRGQKTSAASVAIQLCGKLQK